MGDERHLRHVVLLSFRADAPPDQVATVVSAFAALRHQVPGVVDLEWGTNVSPEGLAQGFTHCFLVTFADAAARDAYLIDPVHVAFTRLLEPVQDRVLVLDFVRD